MSSARKRRASSPLGSLRSARGRETVTDAFLAVLADADLTVLGTDVPLLGSRDVRQFRMQVEKRLTSDPDASLKDKFLAGLEAHFSEAANLKRFLRPINVTGAAANESLARVLLTVACIQVPVANMLLERLPEYFHEADRVPLADNIPRMILFQFRWLDYLVDSKEVMQKLLEVLSICPLDLKKQIITYLPELVSDADHEMVMTSLERMLKEDLQIIVPVLDAFANLSLDSSLHEQIVETALSSLRSADAEDLPLVVRFLLQSVTGENARRIVHQLREDLNFMADVRGDSSNLKLKEKCSSVDCEALVLDALRLGVRFHSAVSEAFLKEIKGAERERHHKVLDIWFLLILHANGGSHRKAAESLLKRKIVNRCISGSLFRQAIKGHGHSLQDYFHTLLILSEAMLKSKDFLCAELGMQMYVLLFEEFSDMYYRQEILGSLITHTGTAVAGEVNTALDTICALVERYPYDVLPLASFMNGILDYLESFASENLHQVYRIFSRLAIACWTSKPECGHSYVANELLIFIKKQVTNSDLRYKHMGIIGVVNLMSALGADGQQIDGENGTISDAVDLLFVTLKMCKESSIARGFFYDELAAHIEKQSVHKSVIEWASGHTNEFETLFLGDLDNGKVTGTQTAYERPEGDLWMNLDGNASPVFLNLLPTLMSNDQIVSSSVIFLCSSFRLLAAVERTTNQGLLGSIDALLGCPIYLPKAEVFSGTCWDKVPRKHKELYCVALFLAVNWIRELINAFSNQSRQSPDERLETTRKLTERLCNLLYMEHVLCRCVKDVPVVLPQLHCFGEYGETCGEMDTTLPKLKRKKDGSVDGRASQSSQRILDASSKTTREGSDEPSEAPKQKKEEIVDEVTTKYNALYEALGSQSWKLRPLRLHSLDLLSCIQVQDVSDYSKLPMSLYLLQDLSVKLEEVVPTAAAKFSSKPSAPPKPPSGVRNTVASDVLSKVVSLFPRIRTHLDAAACILTDDDGEKHWVRACYAPSNPEGPTYSPCKSETAECLILVTACCISKILRYLSQNDVSSIKTLLEAFSWHDNTGFVDLAPVDSPGYIVCAAYSYFDNLLVSALRASLNLSTDVVMLLKDLRELSKDFIDENDPNRVGDQVSAYLTQRLSSSAKQLLDHDWGSEEPAKAWSGKHDVLQRLLWLVIESNPSPAALLDDLASNIMTQVPASGVKCTVPGYPALGPGTFLPWYRVQHEVVLQLFAKVAKEILVTRKGKSVLDANHAAKLLEMANQYVHIHVQLVTLVRTHDKSPVHAVALKFGGKFVDTFLKTLDFLEASFEVHKDIIISTVKELQKATRTIQTICAEAKGQKKLPVACKVPAVKRSMERYVFCMKDLLHRASGSAFWMGNLKHKDLQGREIGSQLPVSDDENQQQQQQQEVETERNNEDVNGNGGGVSDDGSSASMAAGSEEL